MNSVSSMKVIYLFLAANQISKILVDIILRAAWTGPMRMIFIGLQVRSICIGRSKGGTCRTPQGLNVFNSIQFLGKIWQRSYVAPQGNPGSATDMFELKTILISFR